MTKWLIKIFIKNNNDVRSPAVRTAYGKFAGAVGIVCNILLCIVKLIIGTFSGSISITADAVNNLSDASSGVVTMVGFKLSGKPADKEHPFGHARIEYLSGLCVAVMILIIGLELLRSGVDKILHPSTVEFSLVMAIVLFLSIGVKLWMAFFYRKIGKTIGSVTIEASSKDSRNDVVSTLAVLVANSVGLVFPHINLDGWMGVAVAIFVMYSGLCVIKDTLNPLLGEAPSEELASYISHKILLSPTVLGVHDLIVHDYGPGRCFGSVHVEMSAEGNVLESHDVIDNIERDFLENDNIQIVIHYDPILTGDAAVGSMREWVKSMIKGISPTLSMHDFRMVQGPTHTNLIFDVVMPYKFEMKRDELLREIQRKASEKDQSYYTVVTLDTDYSEHTQMLANGGK